MVEYWNCEIVVPFQYSLLTVTNFKFDKHVLRDILDMTPLKFSEKRTWPGTHDPLNFGGVKC